MGGFLAWLTGKQPQKKSATPASRVAKAAAPTPAKPVARRDAFPAKTTGQEERARTVLQQWLKEKDE